MTELGNVRGVALAHLLLSSASLFENRLDEARRQLLECLAGLSAGEARGDIIWPLEVGAQLLIAEGDTRTGVMLAAAGAALRETTGRTASPDPMSGELAPTLARARVELGDAAYEAARAAGLALDEDEAIALLSAGSPQ
jgi:hypothetical protein